MMIELIVNDKPVQYAGEITLLQLLKEMQLDQQTGIAVAVNQAVIPRINWSTTSLQNQDKVLLIRATQGG